MIGSEALLALLNAHRLDCELHRGVPGLVEGRRVTCCAPVSVREAHWVAERVEFPLSLAYAALHVGCVGSAPLERRCVEVGHEGVRVGVDEDAPRLATNDAFEHFAEFRVLCSQREIGPHLSGRIAQPHRGNVAGDDCGVWFAFEGTELDGGIERVWIAVLKEPRQFGVADFAAHVCEVGFNR